jgi:signal transduction histidine kinase
MIAGGRGMPVKESANALRPARVATWLLQVAAIAVLYHLAARLGLTMASVQTNTSPFWPPAGIAVAALALLGFRVWPGITLGVLVGSLLTGADAPVAVGLAIGNTAEAVVCVYLLRRLAGFGTGMNRVVDVAWFAGVVLLTSAVGATAGVSTLLLAGRATFAALGSLWSTWWIGDLLGALIVAPALMVWRSPPPRSLGPRWFAEGLFGLLGVGALTWYVFAFRPVEGALHQALIYAVFPLVIWVALRAGQHGATLASLVISGIATWGTMKGVGPFEGASMNDALVLLQTFVAVVSLTALVLAAAAGERRKAIGALQQRAEDLSTLNAATATFLTNQGVSATCATICRLAVESLGLDVAWIDLEGRDGAPAPPPIAHGADADRILAHRDAWLPRGADGLQPAFGPAGRIDASDPAEPGACASIPLVFGSRPTGNLALLSADGAFFTPERRLMVQSYGNLAAVAIENAALHDELEGTNRRHRALSQRLMKAQEEERLRLSRELHDESGQIAAALTVQVGLLLRNLDDPPASRKAAEELGDMVGALQRDLHRLAVNLRPASLDHRGLVAATRQLVEEFARQHEMVAEFGSVGSPPVRLSPDVEAALYRIIQEALTNVMLHAYASRVDVMLDFGEEQVRAMVEDDGVGFDEPALARDSHLGFFGMRERVQMLGGTIAIESTAGSGTTVKVEVPYHA